MSKQTPNRNEVIDFIFDLFAASIQSLQVQGGPMVAGLDIKPVSSYRDKLESLLI